MCDNNHDLSSVFFTGIVLPKVSATPVIQNVFVAQTPREREKKRCMNVNMSMINEYPLFFCVCVCLPISMRMLHRMEKGGKVERAGQGGSQKNLQCLFPFQPKPKFSLFLNKCTSNEHGYNVR